MNLKIGLLGGSFDPFHLGHRRVAEATLDQAKLDRLLIIPARVSPHKQHVPPASGEARYLMAILGTLDDPRMKVERWELEREGPSFAYDTVMTARACAAGESAELFWIIGADNLASLMRWHRAKELLAACRFLVVPRSGLEGLRLEEEIARHLPPDLAPRVTPIAMAPVDISSTAIRDRLQAGDSVADQVPRLTALYLERYNLYSAKVADHPC